MTALPNGNAFIAYRNISNSFYGTFKIYSPAGVEVVAPTVFFGTSTDAVSATTLGNDDVLISYQNGGNSAFGTYVIYDASGAVINGPTVFESAASAEMSTTTDANGNGFIACQDGGNSDFGTFAICGEAELILEVVDGNEVHLNNKTDETLELFLSL